MDWTIYGEGFEQLTGSAPSGFMYHSRVIKSSCFLANAGSTMAKGIAWKAVSHTCGGISIQQEDKSAVQYLKAGSRRRTGIPLSEEERGDR